MLDRLESLPTKKDARALLLPFFFLVALRVHSLPSFLSLFLLCFLSLSFMATTITTTITTASKVDCLTAQRKDAECLFPLRYPPLLYQTTTGFPRILATLHRLQPYVAGGGWDSERHNFFILARDDAPADWFTALVARLGHLDPCLTDQFLCGLTQAQHAARLGSEDDMIMWLPP
jgi:hypothetical protein